MGRESTKSQVSASGNNFGPSSKRLYAYKGFLTYEAVWSTLLMLHIRGTNSAKTSNMRAVDPRWLHFLSPFDCNLLPLPLKWSRYPKDTYPAEGDITRSPIGNVLEWV